MSGRFLILPVVLLSLLVGARGEAEAQSEGARGRVVKVLVMNQYYEAIPKAMVLVADDSGFSNHGETDTRGIAVFKILQDGPHRVVVVLNGEESYGFDQIMILGSPLTPTIILFSPELGEQTTDPAVGGEDPSSSGGDSGLGAESGNECTPTSASCWC